MPRIRDLLYRFRPAGAPGVAGPAGVPVDRVSDLAAELAPVLASLAPVQQRCAEIVEAARQEAAEVLATESGTVRAVTARARAGFDAERAAAAAQVRQRWDREAGDLLSAADQEAGRIRDAVLRAGLDPATVPVLPVDLGMMVFTRDELPAVYRSRPVPDDVDYVQPFVQLRLATQATGKVRFEMIDADGQSVFIHEDMYDLHEGMNLVSPSARLPIHDAHAMHREWSMRVSADGVLLAEHRFEWTESTEKVIRRHVQVDDLADSSGTIGYEVLTRLGPRFQRIYVSGS